ncbi:BA5345 family protein, partial [Bacillus safensis]
MVKRDLKKRAKEYFNLKFEWQNRLSKVKEDSRRDYIAKRYAHLLSITHSLGALCFALFLSLIINIIHYILMHVNML